MGTYPTAQGFADVTSHRARSCQEYVASVSGARQTPERFSGDFIDPVWGRALSWIHGGCRKCDLPICTAAEFDQKDLKHQKSVQYPLEVRGRHHFVFPVAELW